MSFEWNEEFIESFLAEYQKHECLWNPYCQRFKDCFARSEALKKIVKVSNHNVNVKDCLCFLRRIREKFIQEQSKVSLSNKIGHCEKSGSRWQNIVEAMFKKIVRDEEQHDATIGQPKCLQKPKLATSYRHTISSDKRKKNRVPIKSTVAGRNKRKTKSDNNCRAKLENRNKCCRDVEKEEKNTCKKSAYTKPQSAWSRQRDNYLDNLTSTRVNNDRISTQGPGYASHLRRLSQVENLSKDGASNDLESRQDYRKISTRQRSVSSHRDATTSLEFISSSTVSSKSPREKAASACSCTKNSQATKTPARSRSGTSDKSNNEKISSRCCCSNDRQESRACEKPVTPIRDKYSKDAVPCSSYLKNPQSCRICIKSNAATKDKCPKAKVSPCCSGFKNLRDNSRLRETSSIVSNSKPTKEKGPSCCSCSKTSRPDSSGKSSMEKVSSCCLRPKSARSCRTCEALNTSTNDTCCKGKTTPPCYSHTKNMQSTIKRDVATTNVNNKCCGESVPSCCQHLKSTQNASTSSTNVCTRQTCPAYSCNNVVEEASYPVKGPARTSKAPVMDNKAIGVADNKKFVRFEPANRREMRDTPKVGTRYKDGILEAYSEFKVVFPNGMEKASNGPSRTNHVVQTDSTMKDYGGSVISDDLECESAASLCSDRSTNTNTKGKGVDYKIGQCESCSCTKHRKITEKANSSYMSCCGERQINSDVNVNANQRSKLTQNFLEILKCAIELDNKKDKYDDDCQKQDCDCKIECSCEIKCTNMDQSIQCQIIEDCESSVIDMETQTQTLTDDKCISCQNFFSSCQSIGQNEETYQGIEEENGCTVPSCTKLLKRVSPEVCKNMNLEYIKCLKCRSEEMIGNENCTCFEDKMEAKMDYNNASISATCLTLETWNGIRHEKCSNLKKKTRHNARKICDESRRPTLVHDCNPEGANRMGSSDSDSYQSEFRNPTSVNYVKLNQYYRSSMDRNLTR